jgi:hypothetical protein
LIRVKSARREAGRGLMAIKALRLAPGYRHFQDVPDK